MAQGSRLPHWTGISEIKKKSKCWNKRCTDLGIFINFCDIEKVKVTFSSMDSTSSHIFQF